MSHLLFIDKGTITEQEAKIYIKQIAEALLFCHSKTFVHRDLKLENILIDEDGYLKVIDFGLAKILKNEEETMTFCGTPEYIAPEVISRKGHDKSVDWWAIGILIYEMLIGVTPFYNKNRNMMLSKIQFSKIVFPDKKKYKIEYSDEVQDIISKLLNKNKDERLGSENGVKDVLDHSWFKDIDIDKIKQKAIKPPFVPSLSSESDTKYYKLGRAGISMADTIIPTDKLEEIKDHSKQFENFENVSHFRKSK